MYPARFHNPFSAGNNAQGTGTAANPTNRRWPQGARSASNGADAAVADVGAGGAPFGVSTGIYAGHGLQPTAGGWFGGAAGTAPGFGPGRGDGLRVHSATNAGFGTGAGAGGTQSGGPAVCSTPDVGRAGFAAGTTNANRPNVGTPGTAGAGAAGANAARGRWTSRRLATTIGSSASARWKIKKNHDDPISAKGRGKKGRTSPLCRLLAALVVGLSFVALLPGAFALRKWNGHNASNVNVLFDSVGQAKEKGRTKRGMLRLPRKGIKLGGIKQPKVDNGNGSEAIRQIHGPVEGSSQANAAGPQLHRSLAGGGTGKGLAPSCSVLSFDWDESNPYSHERMNEGKKPFGIAPGCEETQRCLYMPDHDIFNIMAAGVGSVFPTFQNVLSDRSPSVEQVLANSRITFDEHSSMAIVGIGLYNGPVGIGEYRIVPQFLVTFGFTEVTKYVASPNTFSVLFENESQEQWNHLEKDGPGFQISSKWSLKYMYYPCSIMRHWEELEFPQESAVAFSDSGKVKGTVESVCQAVQGHCVGELQQYTSIDDCIDYLGSLPHHDPLCQERFGDYTALGDSFMCKYLHHFMIQFSPQTHCAHAGKGVMADADGNYKCVPSDCSGEAAPDKNGKKMEPACSAEDAEELAQGIIYALPFCLPSLEMQVCTSNCTQAINTYLGRFAESGVIDSCNQLKILRSSRLLSLIRVDAQVLYHLCSGDPLLASKKLSSFDSGSPTIPKCSAPDEYLGFGLQCRGWDWDYVAQMMFDEWEEKYPDRRVTKSDDVATAECFVFTQLYAQRLNFEESHIPHLAASLAQSDIQIHPNGSPLVLSHRQVSSVFRQHQVREGVIGGIVVSVCAIPGTAAPWMQDSRFSPPVYDTASPAHVSTRAFVTSILPGLDPPEQMQSRSVRGDMFDEMGLLDEEDVLLALAEECFRALLLGEDVSNETFWTSDLVSDIRDIAKLSLTWFLPESWHRAQGYLLGTGYLSERHSIARQLKKYVPPEEMESQILGAGLANMSDVESAYDFMVNFLAPVPLGLWLMARDIIVFVRQDPCRLLPLWQKNPERFIIEYSRLHSPVNSFVTATSTDLTAVQYHISSANLDPAVFPDPFEFDPDRDLSQVLSWNFIEGEGQESHARSCPARTFSVKFVKSHAPRYFPNKVQCANEIRFYHGVKFSQDDSATKGIGKVFKSSTDGSSLLLLFLHGFPDVPLEFAPIISHLQGRIDADYWIVDGWSAAKDASCKINDYASRVATFIESSKHGYDRVFLVGHDYGGLVSWRVAEILGKDILAGLVTFAPRPQIFVKALSAIPAQKVYFSKLMGPLIGSTFLASNNFELIDNLLEGESFWPEFRDEYHRVWDDVGAHGLTCVYRDNFNIIDNVLVPVDLEDEKDIETDVLLINAENDAYYPPKLFHASIQGISIHSKQQVFHREIYSTSHHSVLHDTASEVADHIAKLTKSVNRKRFSLWSLITKPPLIHSSYEEAVSRDATTFYIYVLTFAVMLTGLIMEFTIGPMLIGKLGFGVYLFAQVMAATINFGCFFAANLITLPLFTIGLFKLGYPEVTGHLLAPIKSPEFFFNNKFYRGLSLLSGVAYIIHHSGAALIYMVISFHEMSPLSLGFLALATGFQHLVVFVKYTMPYPHVLLLLGLEIWFQLESYYALSFSTTTAKVGIWMVLASHYIWLIHGTTRLVLERTSSRDATSSDSNIWDSGGRQSIMKRRSLCMYQNTLLNQTDVQQLIGYDIGAEEETPFVAEEETPFVAEEETPFVEGIGQKQMVRDEALPQNPGNLPTNAPSSMKGIGANNEGNEVMGSGRA